MTVHDTGILFLNSRIEDLQSKNEISRKSVFVTIVYEKNREMTMGKYTKKAEEILSQLPREKDGG